MTKSAYARAVDEVQQALRPFLTAQGFRRRERTFNRTTEDGLVQVVNIQMGAADPPGTVHIAGLRENLHGLFTINLGVYVPEVAKHHGGGEAKSWVQEYHCCVRARLGEASGTDRDLWWPARSDGDVVDDILRRLALGGLPFLDRHATRDRILTEYSAEEQTIGPGGSPRRIVVAILLAARGEQDRAREQLARQLQESDRPGHDDYLRSLAHALALGPLERS